MVSEVFEMEKSTRAENVSKTLKNQISLQVNTSVAHCMYAKLTNLGVHTPIGNKVVTYLKNAKILFGILKTNFIASCLLLSVCLLEVTLLLNSANLLYSRGNP